MELVEFVIKYWIEVFFTLVTAVFGWMYRKQSVKIKKKTVKDEAMESALRALLDDAMSKLYEKCKDKKYKTHEESRRFERMYKAYRALDGNGAVTDEYEQFRELELRDV